MGEPAATSPTYWRDQDTGDIMVRIPPSLAQDLRVALQPCACKSPKSLSTAAIRDRFVKGLGQAMFSKPGVRHG